MLKELKESSRKMSQQIEDIREETIKRNHTNLELKSKITEMKNITRGFQQ